MGGMTLPPAAWRDRPGLARLIAALGPGTARIVGGAVRDTLLGLPTADIDLATIHAPDEVIRLLEAVQIKTVPTGIQHGTITAVSDEEVYEVTTLRRDVDTDGRHATVAFTDDWREDAARRDFTFNALYADPESGEIFDYFNGIADLEARHVRFIGNPLVRIAEDHLRILRFFRFLARFGDTPDPAGLAACTDRANDLMALSRERIANELLRLLVAPRAPEVVELMIDRGILAPVLPEIADALRLAALARAEAEAGVVPDPIRRLAALLPPDPAAAANVGARLKLSNLQRRRLESAMLPADSAPRALAYRIGVDFAVDRLLLAGESTADLDGWTPPRLPLSGGQLVAKGLTAGPDVARTLRRIEDRWIAEGFPDAARVAAIADDEVAQLLDAIRKS
ncbi:CCA tRNA nucleotidyltransferase [Sphingomonas sp.]|jgi:poly(A) polymerase|uniref:CCA tRNA nucleotidyltransferase n=1 Tax=Sphingomonas sp. TaxID=28214 RepID=UPI002E325C55|nr:CCA tRNA nucleotidyltransferase [Sphingomonas sp.]HEX4694118.1 CCA tRNA nucleotidyltransferase [Sphingomonas sp.]